VTRGEKGLVEVVAKVNFHIWHPTNDSESLVAISMNQDH